MAPTQPQKQIKSNTKKETEEKESREKEQRERLLTGARKAVFDKGNSAKSDATPRGKLNVSNTKKSGADSPGGADYKSNLKSRKILPSGTPPKKDTGVKLKGLKGSQKASATAELPSESLENVPQKVDAPVLPGVGEEVMEPPVRKLSSGVENPEEVKPVSSRPELSPRSKKVHKSACNFLAVKKRENSEHKVMEAYITQMFPELQNNLKKVHELSLQAVSSQPLAPETEQGIREENDRLNFQIAQAGNLFKKFDKLLIETKTKAFSFMTKAEQGTFKIDEALKVVINDICNYSKGRRGPNLGDDVKPGADGGNLGFVGGNLGADGGNLGDKTEGNEGGSKPEKDLKGGEPGGAAKDSDAIVDEHGVSDDDCVLSPSASESEPEFEEDLRKNFDILANKKCRETLHPFLSEMKKGLAESMKNPEKIQEVYGVIAEAAGSSVKPFKDVFKSGTTRSMIECFEQQLNPKDDPMVGLGKILENLGSYFGPNTAESNEGAEKSEVQGIDDLMAAAKDDMDPKDKDPSNTSSE